jgi:hypothetical protein
MIEHRVRERVAAPPLQLTVLAVETAQPQRIPDNL